jgi:uncharacterized protein YdeI (YjbR/CyaY-like superfamily)
VKPENVLFFDSAEDFREWLSANHDSAEFQWVGFHKKGSGRAGLTYAQAVDEALCFGWIDGQGGPVDETSRAVRFTPRRARSIWSTVNVRKIETLMAAGKVAPAGMRAWEARTAERTGIYGHEAARVEFPPDLEARFRANDAAWDFWNRQPPGYRRQVTWWVINVKKDETRLRRFEAALEAHAAGQRIEPYRPRKAQPA